MNKENISCGLWKTESKKGTKYCKGKIKIEGKEYYINLFKNNKIEDRQPDFNVILKEVEQSKKVYTRDEVVYDENFGKDVKNISDDDLAF